MPLLGSRGAGSVIGFGFSGNVVPAPRGFFGGGYTTNVIQYVNISTEGNSIDFGVLTQARAANDGCVASTTRGIWQGGNAGPGTPFSNVIDFITIASTGNATDFGDLTTGRRTGVGSGNNSTRGVCAGGNNGAGVNIIDFITMASAGNSTDFGDLSANKYRLGSTSNNTRALFFGGSNPGAQNAGIVYITIATAGNSLVFGDLTNSNRQSTGVASPTRACRMGGFSDTPGPTNYSTIDFVTIATTGNATGFGDLTTGRSYLAGIDDGVRGLAAGGRIGPASSNVIDFITIASAGNATDFGDLLGAVYGISGSSSANAGVQ